MKNLLSLTLITILAALLLQSCSQDEGVTRTTLDPAQLESVAAPANMALDSDYYHSFQAHLSGDFDGFSVVCYLLESDGDTAAVFNLYDDAGAGVNDDGKIYTADYSGDVAAGDGIYAQAVNSAFTNVEDVFQAVFNLVNPDQEVDDSLVSTLNVYQNNPPALTVPNLPDSLISGFPAFTLESSVTDPQGYSDIAEVVFSLDALGLEYQLIDPEEDGIFSYFMGPEFSAGKAPGNYVVSFSAFDSLMTQSDIHNLTVFIENTPPVLSMPSLLSESITSDPGDADSLVTTPDPGDTLRITVTIIVVDLQTLQDIQDVHFSYDRPVGASTPYYPMADNGWAWSLEQYLNDQPYLGDETAGDGIYTFTKLYTSAVDPGIHRFNFHCLDRANQLADSVSVSLNIQP